MDRDVARAPGSVLNVVPIAIMAGGWLAVVLRFWLAVWGPLRPYDRIPDPLPLALPAFVAMLALAFAATRVSERYFRLRAFERGGRLWLVAGVRAFRHLVPDGDLINRYRRHRTPGHRVIRTREDAARFVARTQASERGHLALFVAGVVTSVYAAWIGWWDVALWVAVGNVVVNVYPILLQRYTRGRLERVVGAT